MNLSIYCVVDSKLLRNLFGINNLDFIILLILMLIKLVKRLYINHFILEDYGYRKIENSPSHFL